MTNQPVRLIIAEDDYLVNEEIKRSLKAFNYEIVGEASNGEEALMMTCDLKPDVVLMDVKMPKLDGIEASRLIQKKCPTPIVILTSYESSDLLEQASGAGVGAYLTKPPKAEEVNRAIIIAMARHRDLMEIRELYNDLKEALSKIKTLAGIIPICMHCKNIRDDKGYWNEVSKFITEHSEAEFSHSICEQCLEKYYPGIAAEVKAEMKK
ncbi:MAG: response regulator [Proteobacteria bacterium]|nr:response regulator [Pseudomonadota bacterium]MBU1985606.1 response regulator [Pseudomonadota bacterium]